MDGWVKIHRKIRDNWIWDNPEYLRAWLDLIFRANYDEKKILFEGEFKELKCGQFITSVRKLAEAWGWSNSRVLRFLKLLEEDGMIVRHSNSKRTLLTIENYEVYQILRNTSENTNVNASESQKRKKEGKNISSVDKDTLSNSDEQGKLERNFEKIYAEYPKKVGRTEAFKRYSDWVTTGRTVNKRRVKLTNVQILKAVRKYVSGMEQNDKDLQFYKDFSTFMGNSILDYVEWKE